MNEHKGQVKVQVKEWHFWCDEIKTSETHSGFLELFNKQVLTARVRASEILFFEYW